MGEIMPTPKLMNILYACNTGQLPWGVDWDRWIVLCEDRLFGGDPEYILCCGHTLRYPDESAEVVGAGLMLPGPLDHGRQTLTITKAGREFLREHMHLVEFSSPSGAA